MEQSFTLNDLVSLDSGLWQFVVDNKLHNQGNENRVTIDENLNYDSETSNYWIAKSSIQENKSDFLLSNIILPDAK